VGCIQIAGTSRAIRAFVLRTAVEAKMPFSLGSYLLGVGTVVGSLAFGVGGGVVLTHTAMKESPAGPTRVERLARAEPETPAATQAPVAPATPALNQAAASDQVATPGQDHPASVAAVRQDAAPAEQPAAASPDPVQAVQAATPKPDVARQPESERPRQIQAAREPAPMKQAAREPQPSKSVEQAERTEPKSVETRETDRSAERSRHYTERRPQDSGASRTKQRRLQIQKDTAPEDPAPEVAVSGPPDHPRLDLLGGFFGRPVDTND
jgi:hypothetical protein